MYMMVNAPQIARNSGHFQSRKSEPERLSHFSLKSQVFHSFVGWIVLWELLNSAAVTPEQL